AAGLHVAMRLGDLGQRVAPADLDADRPVRDDLEQLAAARLERLPLADEIEQRRARDVQGTSLLQLRRRKRFHGTRRVAECDHDAMGTQTVERLMEGP